ncbi:hypothetical protein M885DRAFT_613962 [Pelagophyceae sp. CCMP2097]|nr:hypothetical protein M885DRAFT_613962 [Pelagophyceae sp. CCMP2097]
MMAVPAAAHPADDMLLDALLEDGAMEMLLNFPDLDDESPAPPPPPAAPQMPPPVPAAVPKAEPTWDEDEPEVDEALVEAALAAVLAGAPQRGDAGAESKESKKQRRLIRNRMSAQLHRERKKAYVDHLEALVKVRDTELVSLRDDVARLLAENLALRARPPGAVTPSDSGYASPASGYAPSSCAASPCDAERGAPCDAAPALPPMLLAPTRIGDASSDDDSVEVKTQRKRPRANGAAATLALAAMAMVAVVSSGSTRRGAPSRLPTLAAAPQPRDAGYALASAAPAPNGGRRLLALAGAYDADAPGPSSHVATRPAQPSQQDAAYDGDYEDYEYPRDYATQRQWAETVELFSTASHNETFHGRVARVSARRPDGESRGNGGDDRALRGRSAPRGDGKAAQRRRRQSERVDYDYNATQGSGSYVVCSQAAGVLSRSDKSRSEKAESTALVQAADRRRALPEAPADADDALFVQIVVPAVDLDFSAWGDHVPALDPRPQWVEIGCNMAYAKLRFS